MRDLRELDKHRIEAPADLLRAMKCAEDYDRARNGVFVFQTRDGATAAELRVIAGSGDGWDHVSVSTAVRCPIWAEMEMIARLFFKDDEVAMQLHVPRADHVNIHPFVLHWWRPLSKLKKISLPPKEFV